MIRVLFLCLGNICRSPMAEAVFQHKVNERGLSEQILVDSAGTGGWHIGERAHSGTRRVLREHSIPYNGRARQLSRADVDQFDYILAMDRSNWENAYSLLPTGATKPIVKLFLADAYHQGLVETDEVPDPYYTGGFEAVYNMIDTACDLWLERILSDEG